MGNATEPPHTRPTLLKELWSWFELFVERRTAFDRRKHPKTFWGGAIFTAIVSYFTIAVPIGAPNPLPSMETLSPYTQTAAVGGLACEQFVPDEWEREVGDLEFDGSVWTIATGSPNGLLRFKERIPLESDIGVVFVPASEKQVNFVITMHDIYELVVGDGGYQGITLKTSRGNGQAMEIAPTVGGERRVIFGDGPMEPGADVKVILSQGVSKVADGSYELILRIAKTSFLELNSHPPTVYATYHFPLSPQFNYRDESAWFSLGLKSASDGSVVAAEILCVDGVQ